MRLHLQRKACGRVHFSKRRAGAFAAAKWCAGASVICGKVRSPPHCRPRESKIWWLRQVDYEIVLPCNNPTSCAIGGDTLYITTARHRLTEEQRKAQPGAGQLWAVKLPPTITGVPEPVFRRVAPA